MIYDYIGYGFDTRQVENKEELELAMQHCANLTNLTRWKQRKFNLELEITNLKTYLKSIDSEIEKLNKIIEEYNQTHKELDFYKTCGNDIEKDW